LVPRDEAKAQGVLSSVNVRKSRKNEVADVNLTRRDVARWWTSCDGGGHRASITTYVADCCTKYIW
jgi:hypothetical protein